MKRVFVGILVLVIVVSCKGKKNAEATSVSKMMEASTEQKGLLMSLDVHIKNKGKLVLYYLLKDQKDITEKHKITVDVTPLDSNQKIDFQFDKDIYPERFFLKLRDDNQSQTIKFNSVTFSLNEKSFSIDGSQFFQFFQPNKCIDYNRDEAIARTKAVEGKYNPTFISRIVLEDKVFLTIY